MRTILHIDMDAFFVSVEQVRDPSLKGKPVIVGGDPDGGRGVVAAASYEARKYGIHSAQPISRAKRLCPHAIFLRGTHGLYSEFSARIFDILDHYSPLVEPMSLDEAYVDLTGCERLHGPTTETAVRIHDAIQSQVGINASVGMATNKLMAKIASGMSKPNGFLRILPGHEAAFLAPLAIGRIPGIGPKSVEEFKRMGIHTVRDLAALPLELLEEVHGEWGHRLYQKARGISQSPVLKRDDTRSISRETTLEKDSADQAFLESKLSWLVEKAASQLREEGLLTRCISLKLRDSNFKTVTRSHTLTDATCEDHVIFDTVAGLFRKLFTHGTCVRLVGVALTSLTSGETPQMELFENLDAKQWQKLYQGIDRIRDKYGFRSILRGSSVIN
jgi:DNA polymerase IV